jgi:hypothetical protein
MRFLLQPTAEGLARARPPVRAFLVFAALALVGLAVQRVGNGGASAAGVEGFYLAGGEPLPPAALWEELHTGAFLYGSLLLVLGSLLAVCPVTPRARAVLFGAAVATALADLGSPFAVVALGGAGALRVATSAAALLATGTLLTVVAVGFGRAGRRAGA